LYLADALDTLCREGRVLVHSVAGTWYTMGDPLNFLKATVAYALRHHEIGKDFAAYLRGLKLSSRPGPSVRKMRVATAALTRRLAVPPALVRVIRLQRQILRK
jgi:UDP-glucose pyrophosphorylase